MAEKSDDIRQLFSHLGLNPGDYHEIRSAPLANATVGEAPRRWPLLQSPPAQPAHIAPAAAPVAVPQAVLASLLPDPVPAPHVAPPVEAPAPAPAAEPSAHSVLPSVLSAVLATPAPQSDLQSLFLSVKEPQTAAALPIFPDDPTPVTPERRTAQISPVTPEALSVSRRAAAMSPEPAPMPVTQDPETRYAPPSRLGPVPVSPRPAPVVAPAPAPAAPPRAPVAPAAPAAAGAKLRFQASPVAASGAAPAAPAAAGESLGDVFRRLSGDAQR